MEWKRHMEGRTSNCADRLHWQVYGDDIVQLGVRQHPKPPSSPLRAKTQLLDQPDSEFATLILYQRCKAMLVSLG